MNDKEKAKLYDEAYKKVAIRFGSNVADEIFPELKEGEDEKIRKELIDFVKSRLAGFPDCKRFTDWLEKQGEQEQDPCEHCKDKCLNCHNFPCIDKRTFEQGKTALEAIKEENVDNQNCVNPVDKVEPKFKMEKGKWYVCDTFRYTDFIVGKAYYCPKNGMLKPNENAIARYVAKDCFHLWTIQDAKDGDVLYSPCCKLLWIYKDEKKCHVGFNLNYNSGSIVINKPVCIPTDAIPATKEQRDLLFQKIKEAVYEWDDNKKELKLLITNGGDFESENCEQNPAWSEEDETGLTNTIIMLKEGASLHFNKKDITKAVNWLKSLRPQNTWKPSDEQINILDMVLTNDSMDDNVARILRELREQLKKLKG